MECPVVINYTEGTYTVTHPETNEVIETRDLKPEERQQPLFEDEEKGANEVIEEAVGGTTDDNE